MYVKYLFTELTIIHGFTNSIALHKFSLCCINTIVIQDSINVIFQRDKILYGMNVKHFLKFNMYTFKWVFMILSVM